MEKIRVIEREVHKKEEASTQERCGPGSVARGGEDWGKPPTKAKETKKKDESGLVYMGGLREIVRGASRQKRERRKKRR